MGTVRYLDGLLPLTCECREDGGLTISRCLEPKGRVDDIIPETFGDTSLEIQHGTTILVILIATDAI
jgi:hypothetical protein